MVPRPPMFSRSPTMPPAGRRVLRLLLGAAQRLQPRPVPAHLVDAGRCAPGSGAGVLPKAVVLLVPRCWVCRRALHQKAAVLPVPRFRVCRGRALLVSCTADPAQAVVPLGQHDPPLPPAQSPRRRRAGGVPAAGRARVFLLCTGDDGCHRGPGWVPSYSLCKGRRLGALAVCLLPGHGDVSCKPGLASPPTHPPTQHAHPPACPPTHPLSMQTRLPTHPRTHSTRTPACLPTRPTDNITQRVFGGTLRSDLVCACCGHVSTSHEQFSHISLDIPPPQQVRAGGGLAWHRGWGRACMAWGLMAGWPNISHCRCLMVVFLFLAS